MPAPKSLLKGFERTVATVKPDPRKRLAISDPDTRGLYLRVTPNGAKSYTIVARKPAEPGERSGKQVWAVLGDVDHMTLEEARERAREGVKRIKQGLDPFPKAEPKKAPETFKEVAESFITRHVDKQALRSAGEIKRQFKKYIYPAWEDRAFLSIRRGDVARLLDSIEDNSGAVMADRVLATLSKLFNWYASREDEYSSPIAKGMGRANARARARKRILSDDEIRTLWIKTEADGAFGAFVRVLLLTSQRRSKVIKMKRDDVSSDGVWTIPAEPREKANPGALKLSALALEVIRAQPTVSGNPYVFAGSGKKAINAISADKSSLDAKLKFAEPWVLHDLRRTAKSMMSRAGVRPDISERVLGHSIKGVEGVYEHHDWHQERGDALEKLAGLVKLIVDPPEGNVVQMRQAAE